MRLSEAIRLGSMLGPQAFNKASVTRRQYFGLVGPKVTAYCAVGAAIVAAGYFQREWAEVSRIIAACPGCGKIGNGVYGTIMHLNDRHRWTRERIADFVEAHEDALPAERHGASLQTTVIG